MGCVSSNPKGVHDTPSSSIAESKVGRASLIEPKRFQPEFRESYGFSDVKELGSGASCQVWRSSNKVTGKEYAVKKLMRHGSEGVENQRLFHNEIRILRFATGPQILKFEDAFYTSSHFVLVTQLCTGGDLFDAVVATNKYSEQTASALVRQMCQALKVCHDRNITHRDLKPENFVFATPEQKALVLIDFGCAGIAKDTDLVVELAGSPYYVAPEIIDSAYAGRRTGAMWKAADVWSVGVIMYLLVHGTPPFNGKDTGGIFAAIKKCSLGYHKSIPISDKLRSLIDRVLVRDWRHRPSIDDLLADPWIADTSSVDSTPLDVQNRLTSFRHTCLLKKALAAAATDHMSDRDRHLLQSEFKKWDTNGDGRLDKHELANFLKSLGGQTDDTLVQAVMSQYDDDNSGFIEQKEFAQIQEAHKMTRDDELQKLFTALDKNGDGTLQKTELVEHFLPMFKSGRRDDALHLVEEMFGEVDTDGNGEIDMGEFLTAMKGQLTRLESGIGQQ